MTFLKFLFRWLPIVAVGIGLAFPFAAGAGWIMRPSLILIMLGAFLQTQALQGWKPTGFLWRVIAWQLLSVALAYPCFRWISPVVGESILVLLITPIAATATAIASSAQFNMCVVTSTVVTSNLLAIVTFPLVVLGMATAPEIQLQSFIAPAKLVGITVLAPFAVASAVFQMRLLPGKRATKVITNLMRLAWAIILVVSISRVSKWTRLEVMDDLVSTVLVPFGIAFATFAFSALSGLAISRRHRLEGMLCFSHKNTGLAILLAIETFSDQVSTAIIAYTLVQNVFFAIVQARVNKHTSE
ncbi:MAG: hypothetical protein F6K19_19440 [Cyanothece sp. SIO1E1]|nr:hypothetical protein [Cyanothece sp. SIO1E1]